MKSLVRSDWYHLLLFQTAIAEVTCVSFEKVPLIPSVGHMGEKTWFSACPHLLAVQQSVLA